MPTLDSNIRWDIEVIAYEPAKLDSQINAAIATTVNPFSASSIQSLNINHMISSFNFDKSKETVENSCQLVAHGMLDPIIACGNWVVIKSSYLNQKSEYFQPKNGIIRFVGQIYDVQTVYMKDGSGAFSRTHTIFVRSWSAILNMPVRYDFASIEYELAKDGKNIASAISILGQSTVDRFIKFCQTNLTAYDAAQMAFSIIIAMNEDWGDSASLQISGDPVPKVALHMPKIPAGVIKHLRPTTKYSKPISMSNSFVKLITGRQSKGFKNDGTWRGILEPGGFSKFVNNYSIPPGTPISSGLGTLFTAGSPMVELMRAVSDPDFNEIIADFLYEQQEDGTVMVHPVLFVRDKPFLLEPTAGGVSASDLGYVDKKIPWTYYSSVPRIKINPESIIQARLGNTIINSSNYIRLSWADGGPNNFYSSLFGTLKGSFFKKELAAKFGTISKEFTTSFIPPINKSSQQVPDYAGGGAIESFSSSVDPLKWAAGLASVLKNWHTYNYRTASGSLIIKDENIPLTIGFNLSFAINGHQLIGHIDGVSYQVAISASGNQSTTTVIKVSRVMKVRDGVLKLFEPYEIANLVVNPPKQVLEESDTISPDLEVE